MSALPASSEPSTPRGPCLECGAALVGEYCVQCGQRADTGRVSLRTWWDAIGDAFSFAEGKFLRTTVGMSRRPGTVPREYAEGRRVRWVGPFRYAVTTSALWLLAFTLVPRREATGEEARLIEAFAAYGQLLNLAILPVLAAAIHVAFVGTRTRYAEHLCLTLFVFGHVFLLRAIIVGVGGLTSLDPQWAAWADQAAVLLYLVAGPWGFHRSTTRVWTRIPRIAAALVLISFASGTATQQLSRYFASRADAPDSAPALDDAGLGGPGGGAEVLEPLGEPSGDVR